MATFIISRPIVARPTFDTYTIGSNYIRGSGAGEVLGYPLSPLERSFVSAYQSFFGVGANTARDVFFSGEGPQFGGPSPNLSRFRGDDRIYGRDGDDYVVDLSGSNFVATEEGDDRILLGEGNDRIFDQGGDNDIDDLGGNNTFTTGDGNDTISTGDGVDNINAFDGTNVIAAGQGNNIVRGGDGYDEIRVGIGDDFIDVRGGFLGEDVNGNGKLDSDPFEDRDFDGVLDLPDVARIAFIDPFLGLEIGVDEPRFFHNVVIDEGGSDNIRSTAAGSRQGDDLILSDLIVDTTVDGGVTQLVVANVVNIGDDTIEVGAGNNVIVDAGGDTTVRTLQGNDTIFTSYFFDGDDDIDAGPGSDSINPGTGSDIVRTGSGDDFVFLESDGDADTLVYRVGDAVPASLAGAALTDVATGFDVARGVDKIDVSALEFEFDDLLLVNAAGVGVSVGGAGLDLLVAWDANGSGALDAGDLFTTILADVAATPNASNFLFDTAIA